MQEIVVKTFNSVRRSIDPLHRNYCFELFGYDFILDEKYDLWLLEINKSPTMEMNTVEF